jgi:indole-3-acetate monooxygenase
VKVAGLHHVAIVAPDLESARSFYGDVLGLNERSDRPTDVRPGHWMDTGGQQLHIVLPGGPGHHLALEVPDIDAAVAELRAKGIDAPDPYGIGGTPRREGEAVQTIFADPFGNRVELTQLAPRRGAGSGAEALAWVAASAGSIAEWADVAEQEGRLGPPLLDALHDAGLFRLLLPSWLDGAELDPVGFATVLERLATVDASTAWCICQAAGCSVAAAYLAPNAAATVFGPARSVVAWGPDAGTEAVAVAGGYRVTGRWSYVSGIHHADWLGGSCRVFDGAGNRRMTAAGAPEVRTMLFPAAHASVTEVWSTVGLRATGTDLFSVRDVFVPDELSFARDDIAARLDPAPLYCFTHANIFAAGFAAVVLGIARGALDQFIAVARAKTPLGRERALRESPVVQTDVARCEARLGAARAFLMSTLADGWREANNDDELSAGTRTAIRLATSHAFSEAGAVVDVAYHAAGIDAVFLGNGLERRLRDIRTATQQFQGRDDHYETVGRGILA